MQTGDVSSNITVRMLVKPVTKDNEEKMSFLNMKRNNYDEIN